MGGVLCHDVAGAHAQISPEVVAVQAAPVFVLVPASSAVGDEELPQLPQARGGMSEQEQQERMHATERQ